MSHVKRATCTARYLSLLTVLGGTAGLTLAAATAEASLPRELLDKLEKRHAQVRTIHSIATAKTTTRGKSDVKTNRQETWLRRSGKKVQSKILTTATGARSADRSEDSAPKMIVSDGTSTWSEFRSKAGVMVIKSASKPNDPLSTIRESMRRARASVTGRETIAGEQCAVLEIVFKDRSRGSSQPPRKETYWLTERHGIVVKRVVQVPDGVTKETTITELEVNQPIDDAVFNYTPPEGADVIDTATIGGKSKP